MKAEIGDIVLYRPLGYAGQNEVAALVTGVKAEGHVSLYVFFPTGGTSHIGNVAYSNIKEAGCWFERPSVEVVTVAEKKEIVRKGPYSGKGKH